MTVRRVGILLVLLLLVSPTWAEDTKPLATMPLAELDALRMENVYLRKQVLIEQMERLRLLIEVHQSRLEALVADAAKRAGVDPSSYVPDVDAKLWRRNTPAGSPLKP